MNGKNSAPPVRSLRELYSKPRKSAAWESGDSDIVRFWTDDGDCWGFLFHHLAATRYSVTQRQLLIDWALGTLVVAGPKVLEFYEDFCHHRATSLKPDGADILSVRLYLKGEPEAEAALDIVSLNITADEWPL